MQDSTMKRCVACNSEIDSKAYKCSHCHEYQTWFRRVLYPILQAFGIGATIVMVILAFGKYHDAREAAKKAERALNGSVKIITVMREIVAVHPSGKVDMFGVNPIQRNRDKLLKLIDEALQDVKDEKEKDSK